MPHLDDALQRPGDVFLAPEVHVPMYWSIGVDLKGPPSEKCPYRQR